MISKSLKLILFLTAILLLVYKNNALSTSSMDFIGKHRRSLRTIANQKKQTNNLPVVHCNIVSEDFMKNVEEVLAARELVQVKFNVEKKKDAKEMGTKISMDTKSLLAQVVGHTVLLYRASSPPGSISKLLKEMVPD